MKQKASLTKLPGTNTMQWEKVTPLVEKIIRTWIDGDKLGCALAASSIVAESRELIEAWILEQRGQKELNEFKSLLPAEHKWMPEGNWYVCRVCHQAAGSPKANKGCKK